MIFAGPCREQFLGMTVEEARTAIWRYYVHPDDVEIFDAAHDGAQVTGRLDVEYRLIGADGVLRWVRDRGRIRVEDGRRFLDGSILDVTEMHRMRERARRGARRGRPPRADRPPHRRRPTAARWRRSLDHHAGRPVGLLLLDLDHFKQINDAHGHAAGDAVLVAVAERLRASVRADDAVVRMGGEEFLVVLRDVADEAQLLRIGETCGAHRRRADPRRHGRAPRDRVDRRRVGGARTTRTSRPACAAPTGRSTWPSRTGATASGSTSPPDATRAAASVAPSRRASPMPPSRITRSWFQRNAGRGRGPNAFIHGLVVRTRQL